MSNVIQFARKRHGEALPAITLEAAARVAASVHLTPGPAETATQFVTRIVRAYKGEGGEAQEVAELREQLATARRALSRLSTFEAFTTEGWGFSHAEITARVEFARAALGGQP